LKAQPLELEDNSLGLPVEDSDTDIRQ